MPNQQSLQIKRYGKRVIVLIEYAGLLVVLAAAIVAAGEEIAAMLRERRVTLADLLLLFIYLEVVSMTGVYWRVGRLPVRMPLYIAMVALARHMMLDTSEPAPLALLAEAAAILVLGLAVLVVRWGHIRLPYTDEGDASVGVGEPTKLS